MDGASTPWWAWFLGVLFSAPWIAAGAWFWRHRERDADRRPPPSMGELLERRLLR
jgi:hypothetical protein